jgi:hypothetical protein
MKSPPPRLAGTRNQRKTAPGISADPRRFVTSMFVDGVAAVPRVLGKQARRRGWIKGKNEAHGRAAEAGRFQSRGADLDMPHVIVEVAAP